MNLFRGLSSKVNIKREFKYLGVIRASPCDYVQRYGNSLVPSSQLPPLVEDFKTPEGLVLAANHRTNDLHELCGDVEALSLIDLEKEGLGGYRQYLQKLFGSSLAASEMSNNNTNAGKFARSVSKTSIAKSVSSGFGAQSNRQQQQTQKVMNMVDAVAAAHQQQQQQKYPSVYPVEPSLIVNDTASLSINNVFF